jgi:hypothetical protein
METSTPRQRSEEELAGGLRRRVAGLELAGSLRRLRIGPLFPPPRENPTYYC